MKNVICPKCSNSTKLQIQAVVVTVASKPGADLAFEMRWLPMRPTPDGRYQGDVGSRIPQRWDGTSSMRSFECGYESQASEFGVSEEVELHHDISTLGLYQEQRSIPLGRLDVAHARKLGDHVVHERDRAAERPLIAEGVRPPAYVE